MGCDNPKIESPQAAATDGKIDAEIDIERPRESQPWREMADFSAMSDAELKNAEKEIAESIRFSEGDSLLTTYFRQQMRALNAERTRRNGDQRVGVADLSEEEATAKIAEYLRNGCGEDATEQAAVIARPTTELITEIEKLLIDHMVFRDARYAHLIAVWVMGTYLYSLFAFYGYLWATSPVRRCGKSRLLDILGELCYFATKRMTSPTEAVLFRTAAQGRTMVLDEVEALRNRDRERFAAIISVLNSGFQRGSTVPRVEKSEAGFGVVDFEVFGPKILAGINSIADTIEDRSFKIPMARRSKKEKIKRFNLRKLKDYLDGLRRDLAVWAENAMPIIQGLYDALPDETPELHSFDDRLIDIAEPLYVIATMADSESNESIGVTRRTIDAITLASGNREQLVENDSFTAVLEVITDILGTQQRLFIVNQEFLEKIREHENLRWLETTTSLARFLGKYDLVSRRDPSGKKRGYMLAAEWLNDAKERYGS